jgi:HTH-type transcriptional repressor of NAD biosynthesis genes
MVDDWIEQINQCDLYLFFENDCPFIQDGTRLTQSERDKLNDSHKQQLHNAQISYHLITGDWNTRWASAVKIVKREFGL